MIHSLEILTSPYLMRRESSVSDRSLAFSRCISTESLLSRPEFLYLCLNSVHVEHRILISFSFISRKFVHQLKAISPKRFFLAVTIIRRLLISRGNLGTYPIDEVENFPVQTMPPRAGQS